MQYPTHQFCHYCLLAEGHVPSYLIAPCVFQDLPHPICCRPHVFPTIYSAQLATCTQHPTMAPRATCCTCRLHLQKAFDNVDHCWAAARPPCCIVQVNNWRTSSRARARQTWGYLSLRGKRRGAGGDTYLLSLNEYLCARFFNDTGLYLNIFGHVFEKCLQFPCTSSEARPIRSTHHCIFLGWSRNISRIWQNKVRGELGFCFNVRCTPKF